MAPLYGSCLFSHRLLELSSVLQGPLTFLHSHRGLGCLRDSASAHEQESPLPPEGEVCPRIEKAKRAVLTQSLGPTKRGFRHCGGTVGSKGTVPSWQWLMTGMSDLVHSRIPPPHWSRFPPQLHPINPGSGLSYTGYLDWMVRPG